ncbi:MAG TPA: sugar phosphate isomerase/epimerase [Dongiaceae bacterium]|nr:sugar phosphate isomerase/epimerase [Dongiaceae bacterium]
MTKTLWSRRSFVATSALLPFALRGPASAVPVGLEMYSVRDELKRDPAGTVRAVAAMGYQGLEFYAPYFDWTPAEAKDMRKLLDDLGIRCFSTHNDSSFLGGEKLQRTIELNLILGSKYAVVASAHPKPGPDAWREVADMLNSAADALEPHGLKTGYHNHQPEFRVTDGRRPMDILAKNTKPSVMLQLDVGTCLEANANPVAWIQANPGRIRSMHCKDWSADPAKGYSVLFGEGDADWKALFQAAEHGGGIEYYLVEQEGSRYAELETAKRCLEAFRKTHGS